MKKFVILLVSMFMLVIFCGFSFDLNRDSNKFDLNDLYDYQKEYKAIEIDVCARKGAKTYMDYRMTTDPSSVQYHFIRNELIVDHNTGFLYDKDGFIAVALGSYYGHIGDRYYFTLDSGIVLPLVKAEEKADEDTDAMGCYHLIDTSVIEFVIDSDAAGEYFWDNQNGLVLNGNYNNYWLFDGDIEKVEKVLDEKNDKVVSYSIDTTLPSEENIFNYASGY